MPKVGRTTAYIEPGTPKENKHYEDVDAHLRDEPLNVEIFWSLRKTEIVIESWQRHHNMVQLHAFLVPDDGAWLWHGQDHG